MKRKPNPPPDPALAVRPPGKVESLEIHRERPEGSALTTDQGTRIAQAEDSLKAGMRGPTLLEDFHLREKITRFDHERIPERVVHARGSGAHGHFRVYESLAEFTRAGFLCDPSARTPVFVRFSTVAGSRGSADTARDVRGFATKFYTREGNFDLVGNNMPVFFIQDAMKFPDLVHAVKPEPHNEIPQASSAHDTLWDFISLHPETAHMILWVMSDRALPRSFSRMEGFGVHTFRLINAEGRSRLCKFHWKPLLGVHSLVWDEAQKLSGKDPDFHRRDLWESIERGLFPEWELGLQIIEEKDQQAYGFDMLDPTKLLPEELVPVRRVGRLTLDRNPDNFFAETEQVAFCVGNIVPGIDFTNDPLMQGRLFSYLDTQLTRLGGPNFAQLPINQPVVPVRNHQQDGFGQHAIKTGRALYHKNSVASGQPFPVPVEAGGFAHFAEAMQGHKVRERSPSFADHFSQATMFLASQSAPERQHLIEACQFELSKVERPEIRERVIGLFRQVEEDFADEVAAAIGMKPAAARAVKSPSTPVGKGRGEGRRPTTSPALSVMNSPHDSIRGRRIACLVAGGVLAADIAAVKARVLPDGAAVVVIGPALARLASREGRHVPVDRSLLTEESIFYDALFIPGGAASIEALAEDSRAVHFVREAFRHAKPIAASGEGAGWLSACLGGERADEPGIVTGASAGAKRFLDALVAAIRKHRHFDRDGKRLSA